MEPASEHVPPGMLARFGHRLTAAVAIAVGLGLAAWYAFPPDVSQGPVRLVRGKDGDFEMVTGKGRRVPRPAVQAGRLEANNSLTATASEAHGDPARLACNRILILGQSSHVLAKRVADCLVQEFKALRFAEEIDYLPPGYPTETGDVAPDVFVTLRMVDLEESGPINHQVKAKFRLTAGTALVRDNHFTVGHLTPPRLDYAWNCVLDHQSTTLEVASSAAQYKLVSEDIGKQLAGALVKQLNQWVDKFGRLPELPGNFYPAYHAPPELPLEGMSPRVLFSGRALMQPNETVWQCKTDRPLTEVVAELRPRLEAAGWKCSPGGDGDAQQLQAALASGRLSVFPEDAGLSISSSAPSNASTPTQSTTFYVRYTEPISETERDQAVSALIASAAPLETILLFQNQLSSADRATVLARLAAEPVRDAPLWLASARFHHALKQDEAARLDLLKAIALAPCESDPLQFTGQIKGLAKSLGDEKLAEVQPDLALYKELGFVEIGSVGEVPEVEIPMERAANYVARLADDKLSVMSLRLKRDYEKSGGRYALATVQTIGNARMSSLTTLEPGNRGPFTQSFQLDGLGRVEFTIAREFGRRRLHVRGVVRPDNVTTPATTTADARPGGA